MTVSCYLFSNNKENKIKNLTGCGDRAKDLGDCAAAESRLYET